MSDRELRKVCLLCAMLGTVAAWGALVAGGVVGGLPYWFDIELPRQAIELGAYLSAFGLLLFLGSYFLMRFAPRR